MDLLEWRLGPGAASYTCTMPGASGAPLDHQHPVDAVGLSLIVVPSFRAFNLGMVQELSIKLPLKCSWL